MGSYVQDGLTYEWTSKTSSSSSVEVGGSTDSSYDGNFHWDDAGWYWHDHSTSSSESHVNESSSYDNTYTTTLNEGGHNDRVV